MVPKGRKGLLVRQGMPVTSERLEMQVILDHRVHRVR